MKQRNREPARLGIDIQVDSIAMQKLWTFVDLAKGELSAIGTVDTIKDESTGQITVLRVTDFHLLDQVCSDTETEIDPNALANLMTEQDPEKLRCWVHSHGTMGVFWSTQDDACIEGLANGEWLLSLVVNKDHDTMMRLDQYHPCHLCVSDVTFDLFNPISMDIQQEWTKEFKDKVIECVYPARTPYDFVPDQDDDYLWEDMYVG